MWQRPRLIGTVATAVVACLLAGCANRRDSPAQISVGPRTISRPIQPGFVGLSLEYPALPAYVGTSQIDPLLVRLIRQLAPGQTPVLRIGGNSTDSTWWPLPGVTPPAGVTYSVTPAWLADARALAGALDARLVLGINMAADSPTLALAEARALEAGIGPQKIEALELGNEPDLYGRKPGYKAGAASPILARPAWYDLASFSDEFARFRRALAPAPIAGPAFAWLSWMGGLGRFLSAEPGLALVTFHRYPLHGCNYPPSSPAYGSIPHLLSAYASSGLAQPLSSYAAVTHAHGLRFRVDELNSVACGGKGGVSDAFASALWALGTLLDMARAGVDGVNIHTFPGAGYELFSFRQAGGRWQAAVRPEYYGLELFAQAAPAGARLLDTTPAAATVRAWATRAPDGTVRVVLINDDLSQSRTVSVAVADSAAVLARVEQLVAPSARATDDVTLGGQSYGTWTSTGKLSGRARRDLLVAAAGRFTVTLPPASAALITLIPGLKPRSSL